jgi:hypothetical protein
MRKEAFLARKKKAIDTVYNLLADIESSARRGVAVFGQVDFLGSILPSFIGSEAWVNVEPKIGEAYSGERRDLKELLGCEDWVSTARAIAAVARQGNGGLIRPGDYFRLPIKAEGGSFGDLDFEALYVPDAELVVAQTTLDGKVIFNFEEVLFYSAINPHSTNEGGFKESALSKYLNGPFLAALDPIRGVLRENRHGSLVTLPALFEVFGIDSDDENIECNWEEEARQLEYFKKIKNRIRVKSNNTCWWWLSAAANSTHFARVDYSGGAGSANASNTSGGVAPAVCIS